MRLKIRSIRTIAILVSLTLAGYAIQAQTSAASKTRTEPKAKTDANARADTKADSKTGPADSATLVDINSATAAELKALPGIGDTYAAAIAKNRPYKTKAQLQSRKVVPDATYNKIKDRIVAKQ